MESYENNSSINVGKPVCCPIKICNGEGNTMHADNKGHYLAKYCPHNPNAERPKQHIQKQPQLSKRSA